MSIETRDKPRDGYVSFTEHKDYDSSENTVFTLRTKKKLMEDFDKCCKFKLSTKAKIVRKLIENFIEETEQEMKEYSNIVDYLLTLPVHEQHQEVQKLDPQQQLEFFNKKMELELNMSKDKSISDHLDQEK